MKTPLTLALLFVAWPLAADLGVEKRACTNTNLTYEERLEVCRELAGRPGLSEVEQGWVWRQIGNLHRWQDQHAEAIEAYTESISHDSTNDIVFQSRGISYYSSDQDGLAEADYTSALDLDPHNDYTWFLRGRLLCSQRRWDEGLEDYRRALEIDPSARRVYVARAGLYIDMEELELAVADYSAALEMSPYDAEIYADRGDANLDLGSDDAALYDLAIATSLNPNDRHSAESMAGIVPAPPAAPEGASPYETPAVGRTFTYLHTLRKYVPPKDPMEEAIMALAAWFAEPAPDPVPTRRVFVDRTVTGLADGAPVIAPGPSLSWDRIDAPEGFTPGYHRSMWVDTVPMMEGMFLEVELDEAAIDSLWPLAPGNSAEGVSDHVLVCPADENPMLMFLGCQAPGDRAVVASVRWRAQVVGWEQVVVPAGAFMALVVKMDESHEISMMGQSVTRGETVTHWYVPELGWWVKRARLVEDDLTTDELTAIS